MKAHDYIALGAGLTFGLGLVWLLMWLLSAYFEDKVISNPWAVTDPERTEELERQAPEVNRRITHFFRRTQWVSIMFVVAGAALVVASAMNGG